MRPRSKRGNQLGSSNVRGATLDQNTTACQTVVEQLNNGMSEEDALHLLNTIKETLSEQIAARA